MNCGANPKIFSFVFADSSAGFSAGSKLRFEPVPKLGLGNKIMFFWNASTVPKQKTTESFFHKIFSRKNLSVDLKTHLNSFFPK